jgi:hypothetical protein
MSQVLTPISIEATSAPPLNWTGSGPYAMSWTSTLAGQYTSSLFLTFSNPANIPSDGPVTLQCTLTFYTTNGDTGSSYRAVEALTNNNIGGLGLQIIPLDDPTQFGQLAVPTVITISKTVTEIEAWEGLDRSVIFGDTPFYFALEVSAYLGLGDTIHGTLSDVTLTLPDPSTGPIITHISPTTADPDGGTNVTITGNNFVNGATVDIGGTPATDVIVVNSTTITAKTPALTDGPVTVTVTNPDTSTGDLTNVGDWWKLATTLPYQFYHYSFVTPDPFIVPANVFVLGTFIPAGTSIGWEITTAPADVGWWLSIGYNFAGAADLLDNNIPRNPRGFIEIDAFATGATGFLGGFPGPCCVYDNALVYAKGGYTVGADSPPIHIFDGEFDRQLVTLPLTSTGAKPIAVMSMLAANGTIYVSTLDSGSDSSSWVGRVFSLNIETGTLTELGGSNFTVGHVPYALAFHQGRLWVGTHRGDDTVYGKIYFFRPDIDASWTVDKDLATSELNVASMLSFQGLLYVGTTGHSSAAVFGKVLVRGTNGAYTTSLTGSGGTATGNNGFLALAEFKDDLYASFWNPDSTAVAKVYSFDGSSWSAVFSGATTTLVPYIGFPTDQSTLFVLGGGLGYNAVLLETTDGASWHDRTAFLTQSSPASTGVPCFGVVVR